jgi:hypothetical protein
MPEAAIEIDVRPGGATKLAAAHAEQDHQLQNAGMRRAARLGIVDYGGKRLPIPFDFILAQEPIAAPGREWRRYAVRGRARSAPS